MDAAEIWLWHGGGALVLQVGPPDGAADGKIVRHVLGPDVAAGQVLQAVVPAGAWQEAAPLDDDGWVLVGCVVAPAFASKGSSSGPRTPVPPRRAGKLRQSRRHRGSAAGSGESATCPAPVVSRKEG